VTQHELTVGWQLREYYHRDHSHTTDHTQWRTEMVVSLRRCKRIRT
jgi:hypothetical protein